ncbi:hypothetical protein BDV95DRAFT_573005 [Massariosphaeria phaeospora]|uniref:Uncharacterized protein n=1 Tax=Massariosphaeria phaeospora TaxID=100035 RepID=A0A7C8M909_9PLEO|nr:hypothetical protein BDV95DRAFT_573005 [Massariosphaeria phaeospora]
MMASTSKFFSWSKGRQPDAGPYHRTGGLLAIDTSVGDTGKEAVLAHDPKAGRRRPPNLNLTIPQDYQHHRTCLTPASARQNAVLVNSASNLLAVFNDLLRSPPSSATVCPGSASIHKPLPSRPRSMSLPSTPDLPAELPGSLLLEDQELPGSILLENQGLPLSPGPGSATRDTMRPVRSGNSLSLSSNFAAKPQHKKSLSETSLQRARQSKSRPNLITSPSSTDSKLTACSMSTNGGQTSSNDSTKTRVGADKLLQPSPLIVESQSWRRSGGERSNRQDETSSPATPTPTTTRSKQIEELKATITAQDQTISTLQTQFGSLRASHEAHVETLATAHTAEVATLKNYSRVLEEQQSQRTLHHASSNHLLLLLDTTEPQSPSRESPQITAGNSSANSIRSFKSALEQQTRSPHPLRETAEMDHLKRKLTMTRRPETNNRDIMRELNLYRQNNVALQKQIESLMSKLNQSKKSERALKQTLEEVEKHCTEYQEKASNVERLKRSTVALQNTIDQLEYRLEMANCEKVDAEEHLFNLQAQRSPFDPTPPNSATAPVPPNVLQSAHNSVSTVFSSGSSISPQIDSQDPSTLAAFIAHIERLQEQVKQKDAHNSRLEQENTRLQSSSEQLESELRELTLQSDIQNQLLGKNKQSEVHVDQLRTAIIDREATIGEKDKALRMAERQLEHHKLLLYAEIRRHSTMTLLADVQADSLPDLTTLASKEDVDRWIGRLQARLKKDNPKAADKRPTSDVETILEDLRSEVDFYVREIIYYKLDIKGYKSDIKKLKHIALRMGNYGSRTSDYESPTPSGDTPTKARFASVTPGLGISNTSSPISACAISTTMSTTRPITPPATTLTTPEYSPAILVKSTSKSVPHESNSNLPMTPRTPTREAGANLANESDNIHPGISPRSVVRLSPERRKPTQPSSPDQEKFGDLATNFPLSTPAAPQRHDTQRSMSDSIIQLYAMPRTPERSPKPNQDSIVGVEQKVDTQTRGHLVPDPTNGKATPERPPRPCLGLFESPIGRDRTGGSAFRSPPRMDIMAEAMRNSPEQPEPHTMRPALERGFSGSAKDEFNTALSSPSAIPAPLTLRPRAGSAESSTADIHIRAQSSSPPPRTFSNGSNSNIPFVISMGSPHNPALLTPTKTALPGPCSITGKAVPMKVASPTPRAGVGGTMASSLPPASPSPTHTSKPGYFFGHTSPVAKSQTQAQPATKSIATTRSRTVSLTTPTGRERATNQTGPGTTGTKSRASSATHARNASGSSIRSAMQLPSSLMRGKGKARKDSISHPTPLASPFDIDRSSPAAGGFEIGEAI